MKNIEENKLGLKQRLQELSGKFGLDQRALLFSACCLTAAPLLQAAWVILQSRVFGLQIAGGWHTPATWLFTEGRVTLVPILIALFTFACWKFGKLHAIPSIALCLVSCYLNHPQNDHLLSGVYLLVAILLGIYFECEE